MAAPPSTREGPRCLGSPTRGRDRRDPHGLCGSARQKNEMDSLFLEPCRLGIIFSERRWWREQWVVFQLGKDLSIQRKTQVGVENHADGILPGEARTAEHRIILHHRLEPHHHGIVSRPKGMHLFLAASPVIQWDSPEDSARSYHPGSSPLSKPHGRPSRHDPFGIGPDQGLGLRSKTPLFHASPLSGEGREALFPSPEDWGRCSLPLLSRNPAR